MFARILVPCAALACIASAGAQQPQLPLIEVYAGMHRLETEVAATQQTRQIGMMLRSSMPAHRAMLFVFPELGRHCMWMKNTLVPLSVAFLDDAGRIVNIEDMQPRSENNHCAAKPVRYALEANQGWFKARGIGQGFVLTGIERAAGAH